MKVRIKILVMIVLSATLLMCCAPKQDVFKPEVVYQSNALVITQIAENSFVHTSFLQTDDFGNVPCNGLIVRNSNEAIVFDTPTCNNSSEELITWITETLDCKINAIIPTHFHNDCVGGLKTFEEHGIPSYAYFKTVELTRENNFTIPQNSFRDTLTVKVGNAISSVRFFGAGHTIDNIVGYYPDDNVLFGGCLIKEAGASKGYLGDAHVAEWSNTVEKIKKRYPNVGIVVPGHGESGTIELLEYTIQLFKTL
jgi:metallo-beta-lactamase class B